MRKPRLEHATVVLTLLAIVLSVGAVGTGIFLTNDRDNRAQQLGVELQQSERNNAVLIAETTKNAQLQDTQIKTLQAEIISLKKERDTLALALRAEARASRSRRYSSIASDTRVSSPPDVVAATGSVWDRLAQCESGGRWGYNGPSGYDGGLQFSPSTWRAYGGSQYAAYAWQASRLQQIAVAERVQAGQGWGAWPACSRKLGLR